jgi:hypothetical protein
MLLPGGQEVIMNDDGSWSVPGDPELEQAFNEAYTREWHSSAISPVPLQNWSFVRRKFQGTVLSFTPPERRRTPGAIH